MTQRSRAGHRSRRRKRPLAPHHTHPARREPFEAITDAARDATATPSSTAVPPALIAGLRDDTIWLGLARQFSTTTILTAWLVSLHAGPVAVGLLGALPFLARVAKFLVQPTMRTMGPRALLWPMALVERTALLVAVLIGLTPMSSLTTRTVGLLLAMTVASVAAALYDQVIQDALVEAEHRTGIRHLLGIGLGERSRWTSWAGMGASLVAGLALDAVERYGWVSRITARVGAVGVGVVCGLVGLIGTMQLARAFRTLLPPAQTKSTRTTAEPQWWRHLFAADRWQVLRSPTTLERSLLAFAFGWGLTYGLVLRHLDVATLNVMGFTLGMLTLTLALTAGASALSAPWWAHMMTRSTNTGALVSLTLVGLAATTLLDTIAILAHASWLVFASRALVGLFVVGWTITIPVWLQYADLREGAIRGSHTAHERSTVDRARASHLTALFFALYGTGAAAGPVVGGIILRALGNWPMTTRYTILFFIAACLRLVCAVEAGRRFGARDDPWGLALCRQVGRRIRRRARRWDWSGSNLSGPD